MEYLKVWTNFAEVIEPLNDSERGRLFTMMLGYAATGEQPELKGNERYVWPIAKQAIDRTKTENDRLIANGSKGGRPKAKETNENQTKPTETNANQQKPYKEKEKDKENILDDDNNARAREIELPEHVDIPVDHQASDIPEWVDLLTMYKIDLTPAAWEELRQMQEDGAGSDLICWAIERAVDANAKNWNYISRVIDRCVAAGIKTASQAEEMRKKTREEKQKQQTVQKPAYNPQPQQPKKVSAQMYTQREYSDDFMNGFVDDALEETRRLHAQRARESA